LAANWFNCGKLQKNRESEMLRIDSTMLLLATKSPGFSLVSVDSETCPLSDF